MTRRSCASRLVAIEAITLIPHNTVRKTKTAGSLRPFLISLLPIVYCTEYDTLVRWRTFEWLSRSITVIVCDPGARLKY